MTTARHARLRTTTALLGLLLTHVTTAPSPAEAPAWLPPGGGADVTLADGRTVAYAETFKGRVPLPDGTPAYVAERRITVAVPGGAEDVLVAWTAVLTDPPSSTGGSRIHALLPREERGDVVLLTACSGRSRDSTTIEVFGMSVPLDRRHGTSGSRALPAELAAGAWQVVAGGSDGAPAHLTGLAGVAIGDAVLVVLQGPEGPLAEIAVDPVKLRAFDLLAPRQEWAKATWAADPLEAGLVIPAAQPEPRSVPPPK